MGQLLSLINHVLSRNFTSLPKLAKPQHLQYQPKLDSLLSLPNMSSYNTDSDDVESIVSDISPIETKFDDLVEDIRSVLGSSSGIDSDDVDVNDLMNLMQSYSSEENHWKEYALGDPSRSYTRNLVDEGNGKANLLILVWSPGKGI